jgi:multiple antibiotic resistance protein
MFENIVQLTILFLVIFDPMVSMVVFTAATKSMGEKDRRATALIAVGVATLISYLVLLLGNTLLDLFGITIGHFKVAGGVILFILGIEMALGYPLTSPEATKESSTAAIASIIATPLLTGPAAMTAIIVSSKDYGFANTAASVGIVLLLSLLLLLLAARIHRSIGRMPVQVLSTVLGLITIAWGVKFVLGGLGVG